MDRNEMLLEIGAVARRHGVSVRSIRLAEAAGRLPKAVRLESGRRVWFASDFADEPGRPAPGVSPTRARADEAVELATA